MVGFSVSFALVFFEGWSILFGTLYFLLANVEFIEADILKCYTSGLPRIFVLTAQMSLN